MLIGNKLNPNSVINTNLVTDYFKAERDEVSQKPFIIMFGFCAGTSDGAVCSIWEFEKEEDRDAQWNNLMKAMHIQYFD